MSRRLGNENESLAAQHVCLWAYESWQFKVILYSWQSQKGPQQCKPAVGEAEKGAEAPADSPSAAPAAPDGEVRSGKGLQFSDKDEHMYFWFPLLAGLSELTFDPRPDIRYSALEVCFHCACSCHQAGIF